jgi:hypothetical protein
LLAYVFFHRAGPGVEIAAYETALRRFHASLAGAPPPGFVGSTTYRIGDGYGDWYLVENSAALDPLNEAAVRGARTASHDTVAQMSADGAGKLLMLVTGRPRTEAGFEIRLSKPSGISYADFYKKLEPWTARADITLWRRMMVLGPPPEFGVVAPSELELPPEMTPETLHREPI